MGQWDIPSIDYQSTNGGFLAHLKAYMDTHIKNTKRKEVTSFSGETETVPPFWIRLLSTQFNHVSVVL